jgi:hypothetical protein
MYVMYIYRLNKNLFISLKLMIIQGAYSTFNLLTVTYSELSATKLYSGSGKRSG